MGAFSSDGSVLTANHSFKIPKGSWASDSPRRPMFCTRSKASTGSSILPCREPMCRRITLCWSSWSRDHTRLRQDSSRRIRERSFFSIVSNEQAATTDSSALTILMHPVGVEPTPAPYPGRALRRRDINPLLCQLSYRCVEELLNGISEMDGPRSECRLDSARFQVNVEVECPAAIRQQPHEGLDSHTISSKSDACADPQVSSSSGRRHAGAVPRGRTRSSLPGPRDVESAVASPGSAGRG